MTERRGVPGPREERGSAAGSQRHPPHVSESVEDKPVQKSSEAPDDVPALPPNASGHDKVPDQHREGIDPASAYDRRPGEDKDRPKTAHP